MENYDVIIIGAGMAGLSAGYELTGSARVAILEREDQAGYHSTGRSAAVYGSSYGSDIPDINALTKGSSDFFLNPPAGFSEHPLHHDRGVLLVAHEDQIKGLEEAYRQLKPQNPNLEMVDGQFISSRVPILNHEYCVTGIFDRDVFEIDVHAMQEGYVRGIRQQGGALITNFEVTSLDYDGGKWVISNGETTYSATTVINAAGAWVDQVATLAKARSIGIRPCRRSAILVDPPEGESADDWPMVVDFDEKFYFKPDAGKIMVSSANEDLSPPCDAQPEELDIAYAAHYLGEATSMNIKRVDHSWAGLRNFVEDKSMVIGFDQQAPGFFWLAGQGGFGIQTAPAAGRLVAAMVLENAIPEDLANLGLTREVISPARLGSPDV